MEQVNTFSKALIGDVDNRYVDNQQMVFPTLNVRLTNVGGKGLIPTTIRGNKKLNWFDNAEYGNTVKILGACEHNGILYLAITYIIGSEVVSAIVSYPGLIKMVLNYTYVWSINEDNSNGFERKPKPLRIGNYGTASIKASRLNFEEGEHVKMIAKPVYDGSVDLYVISKNNPNRVINTGFDQDGVITQRNTSWDDFENGINDQVLLVKKQPVLKLYENKLRIGGNLKPGNYFLFIRYLTQSFNRTKFSNSSMVIPVANGTDIDIFSGAQEKYWPSSNELRTNKSIPLEITEVSDEFTYFEIGVMRFSSLQENTPATADIYLIDKYYKVNSLATNNVITINGNEEQRVLTSEEITEVQNTYYKCNTQAEANDRYLGGSWLSYYDKELEGAVKAFAANVTMEVTSEVVSLPKTFDSLNSAPNQGYQFNKIETIRDKVGYIPNEIYGFGLYVTTTKGYKSKIYPLNTVGGNSKGLMMFANTDYFNRHYLELTFPNSDYFTNPNEIDGIYIVRSDRSGNFLYNGLLTHVVNKTIIDGDDVWINGNGEGSALNLPVLKPKIENAPEISGIIPTGKEDHVENMEFSYSSHSGYVNLNKYAMWCPDYLLGKRDRFYNGENVYMMVHYDVSDISNDTDTINGDPNFAISPYFHGFDINNYTNADIVSTNTSLYHVEQLITEGPENFTSYIKDGMNKQDGSGFFHDNTNIYNRSYKTLPYIGLIVNQGNNTDVMGNSIVSLFKTNPNNFYTEYISSFNIETTQYTEITYKLKLNDIKNGTLNVYGGDAYTQKTFWRAINHYDYDQNARTDNSGKLIHYGFTTQNYYYHGQLIGFQSINTVNAQIRNDVYSEDGERNVITYSWFPYVRNKKGVEGWLFWTKDDDNVFESLQMNDGYNSNLLKYGQLGFNEFELVSQKYPNRVFVSARQESGSYIDNYRNISVVDYKDFNIPGGEIISLQEYMNKLMIIQQNEICEIYLEEERIQQSESGNMIIATGGELLSSKFNKKSMFGAQYEKAIVKTQTGIYGVDEKRRILWRIAYQSTDSGSYLAVEDYGIKIGIQDELNKAMLHYPSDIDILTQSKNGVVMGYDNEEKEIHATFNYISDVRIWLHDPVQITQSTNVTTLKYYVENHGFEAEEYYWEYVENRNGCIVENNFITIQLLDSEINDNHQYTIVIKDVTIKKTIIISEKYNLSMGLRSYYPSFYFNLNNSFFTQENGLVFEHNKGAHNEFNNVKVKSTIGFIVNGQVSEKENYTLVQKIFESIAVESNTKPLAAYFITDNTYSQYDYSTSHIALKSKYFKGLYYSPIPPSEIPNRDYQFIKRPMEGTTLKVLIDIMPNGDNENYIKSVITKFA